MGLDRLKSSVQREKCVFFSVKVYKGYAVKNKSISKKILGTTHGVVPTATPCKSGSATPLPGNSGSVVEFLKEHDPGSCDAYNFILKTRIVRCCIKFF